MSQDRLTRPKRGSIGWTNILWKIWIECLLFKWGLYKYVATCQTILNANLVICQIHVHIPFNKPTSKTIPTHISLLSSKDKNLDCFVLLSNQSWNTQSHAIIKMILIRNLIFSQLNISLFDHYLIILILKK